MYAIFSPNKGLQCLSVLLGVVKRTRPIEHVCFIYTFYEAGQESVGHACYACTFLWDRLRF